MKINKFRMFCIYRLYINNTTIYIGKCKNMNNRMRTHKLDCFGENRRGHNCRLYTTIRQLGITKEQFYNFVKYEILYENIPEEYNKEMENLIIKLYREIGNCNLWNELNGLLDMVKREKNRKIYRENNKEVLNEKKKIYWDENKELINKKRRDNYVVNKDVMKEKLNKNLKKYRQTDKYKETAKIYYEKNKEKINKKINCPQCNLEMNKKSLSRHQRRRHKTV